MGAFHRIARFAFVNVHNQGRPPFVLSPPHCANSTPSDPSAATITNPCRLIKQQVRASDDRIIDRVPVCTQIVGDLRDTYAVHADLKG